MMIEYKNMKIKEFLKNASVEELNQSYKNDGFFEYEDLGYVVNKNMIIKELRRRKLNKLKI